jgi:hypothetical protein
LPLGQACWSPAYQVAGRDAESTTENLVRLLQESLQLPEAESERDVSSGSRSRQGLKVCLVSHSCSPSAPRLRPNFRKLRDEFAFLRATRFS